MDALTRERDRLLQRSSRLVGLGSATLALVCLLIPGTLDTDILIAVTGLFVVLLTMLSLLGGSRSLLLILGSTVAALAIAAIVQVPFADPTSPAVQASILILCGATVPALAFVLVRSLGRALLLAASFLVALALTATAGNSPLETVRLILSTAFGWAVLVVAAHWLAAGVPRAARSIMNIGRAHRAERRASETEAQRRQGARLLHDTVLATLTLLAHSGVGVSRDAMRRQAADDARLLRQLRLGGEEPPKPMLHSMEPVSETPLGTTLESVKQRFGRMGLDVQWHGTGHVLLPSETLDAFLLALSECLENVRRHAGVDNAHVTITEDDTTVRAMVTDQGVGFDLDLVDETHLGFKESIVGRLREVGGNARLFSAPGSGTTVVLEVPRA